MLAALALVAAASTAAQQGDTTSLGLDPAVRMATLPNGLRYYVRANRQPEQRAELRLVVNAGSVLEDDDQRGLAHFAEHMAFNGTSRFPKQALVDFIEGLGMQFGAHLNASTSFDETVFQLQVPTDSAGILPRALDVLEDWAHGIQFDSAEVERERGVVIEEWRLGLGAGSRLLDRQLPILFQGSRYADRLPIGDRRTLETFSQAALVRFYRDWYRPDLMAVVAVGDFDVDSVERLIRDRFAGFPNPASPRPRPVVPVPVTDTALVAVATDPEASGSRANVAWRLVPRDEGTMAAYRQSLVERLRDQMLNDRLGELTSRPNPPFMGAGASRSGFVRGVPVYSVGVSAADNGLPRALEATLIEVERASRFGFTPTELERAQQDLARAYERAWAERDKTPSPAYVGEYIRHFLEQEPSPGIEAEYGLVRQLIPGITLEEVSAAARRPHDQRGQILLVTAPEKPDLAAPDGPALLALIHSVWAAELSAYDDQVSDAPLVPSAPAPRAIISERVDPRLGTITWTLASGTRVIVRPTDFRADEVVMTAWSPGGSSLAPDAGYLSSALATSLVGLGGLGTFDAVALEKKLAGRAARVTPYLTATQEGLSGGGSPRDLGTLFELIYLTFTAPRADTAAFTAFITNARASLVNRGASPEAVFADTVQAIMTQHHPRTRAVTPGAVDSLDLGTAYRFYRDRFADASDFTFVFVGNIVPDSIRPLVERWIGGLPALLRRESWRDLGIVPPRGVIERAVRKGREDKSSTRIVFTGPFEYTRTNRAALSALSDVLTIRLREQLREALGGTYGVDVQASPIRWPRPSYSFTIGFGSAPARADELTRATFAAIDSVRTGGPTGEELAKVREGEIRSHQTALRQNRYWASQLAFYDQTGEDPMALLDPQGDAGLITADMIRQAARRYLDPANYVRVTLLPETGGPP